jgi:hypothetical protein
MALAGRMTLYSTRRLVGGVPLSLEDPVEEVLLIDLLTVVGFEGVSNTLSCLFSIRKKSRHSHRVGPILE